VNDTLTNLADTGLSISVIYLKKNHILWRYTAGFKPPANDNERLI
jgi:hypothetical protein